MDEHGDNPSQPLSVADVHKTPVKTCTATLSLVLSYLAKCSGRQREMICPVTGAAAEFRCSHSQTWRCLPVQIENPTCLSGGKGRAGSEQHAKFYFKYTSVPAWGVGSTNTECGAPRAILGTELCLQGWPAVTVNILFSSTFMSSREDFKKHFD